LVLIDQARINCFAGITEGPNQRRTRHSGNVDWQNRDPWVFILSMASFIMQDNAAPFDRQAMNLIAGFDRLQFLILVLSSSKVCRLLQLKYLKQTSTIKFQIVTTLRI
jgi:hypothetical protein